MLSIGIKLSIDDFALAFKRSNLFLAFKTRSSCLNVLLNSFEFRLLQTSTSVFRVCVTICGETSSWSVGGKGIPHASDVLCWFRPHVLRCWGSAIQLCQLLEQRGRGLEHSLDQLNHHCISSCYSNFNWPSHWVCCPGRRSCHVEINFAGIGQLRKVYGWIVCVCVCVFDKLDCVFLYCSLIGFHYKFNLCTGCSCSDHSRASAKYLCKTCSKRSSTCDATCCNGLYFAMYWQPSSY